MNDNGVELREAGETEEDVYNIGGKFRAFLPVFP